MGARPAGLLIFDATAVDEPLQLLEVLEALYDMAVRKGFQFLQAVRKSIELCRQCEMIRKGVQLVYGQPSQILL